MHPGPEQGFQVGGWDARPRGVDRPVVVQGMRGEGRDVEHVRLCAPLRVEGEGDLPSPHQLVHGAVLVIEIPDEDEAAGAVTRTAGAMPSSRRGKHRMQCCATLRLSLK